MAAACGPAARLIDDDPYQPSRELASPRNSARPENARTWPLQDVLDLPVVPEHAPRDPVSRRLFRCIIALNARNSFAGENQELCLWERTKSADRLWSALIVAAPS